MKVIFTWKSLIVMNGVTEIARYPANCNVRNELNGKRRKDEVVYTLPEKGKPKPYFPRAFPGGIFEITGIEYTEDVEYAPVKIKTNATREVFTWDLNTEGKYWEPTGRTQIDTCYWIHFYPGIYSLGCIHIDDISDTLSFAQIIEPVLEYNDKVFLEVL